MKVKRVDTNNVELKEMTKELQNFSENVSLDNMKHEVIEGDISADQVFKHSFKSRPSMWLPIEGNVCVPSGGMTEKQVTITPLTPGKFKIALIK